MTWRGVVGFAGYEVSDEGHIRSLRSGRLLRGYLKLQNGLPCAPIVTLRHEGKTFYTRRHRLVLEAFVGPCPVGMEGCHYDGNPSNNRLDNLRWDTDKNNQADAVRHGTKRNPPIHCGETHHLAKLSDADIRDIRSAPRWRGVKALLSRRYGVAPVTIDRIISGETR